MTGATTLQSRSARPMHAKGESVSDVAMPGPAEATIAVSIHGPAGVLDLVVPAGATSVDVAREYAKQAGFRDVTVLPTGEFGFWRFYQLVA